MPLTTQIQQEITAIIESHSLSSAVKIPAIKEIFSKNSITTEDFSIENITWAEDNQQRNTFLHIAALNGEFDIMGYLLGQGACNTDNNSIYDI